jgi:hypothetical protein
MLTRPCIADCQRRVLVLSVLIGILFLSGCGGGSSTGGSSGTGPPGAAGTTFEGTIAGGDGTSGAFFVTIQPDPSVSGTLNTAAGTSNTLAGTYDSSTNNLSVSGGGFTLTGAISEGVLSGAYTGPNGSSGGFSALNATQTSVTPYCGTFSGSQGTGVFNAEESPNGALSGNATPTMGASVNVAGQVSGATFTGTTGPGNSFSGTIGTGSISGTVSSGPGGPGGPFTGSTGGCGASLSPPPPAGAGTSCEMGIPPNPPTGLTSTVSNGDVSLSWSAPSGGCAAEYFVQAFTASGCGNLAPTFGATDTITTTTSYVDNNVVNGVYYVSVLAVNSFGDVSAPSNQVIVSVAGSGGVGVQLLPTDSQAQAMPLSVGQSLQLTALCEAGTQPGVNVNADASWKVTDAPWATVNGGLLTIVSTPNIGMGTICDGNPMSVTFLCPTSVSATFEGAENSVTYWVSVPNPDPQPQSMLRGWRTTP